MDINNIKYNFSCMHCKDTCEDYGICPKPKIECIGKDCEVLCNNFDNNSYVSFQNFVNSMNYIITSYGRNLEGIDFSDVLYSVNKKINSKLIKVDY